MEIEGRKDSLSLEKNVCSREGMLADVLIFSKCGGMWMPLMAGIKG